MERIEKMLQENKICIEDIAVPAELEERLQGVLAKRKRKKPLGLIAAVLIGAFLLTYNYSAIAYHTRQLVGFDVVMSDTLSDLNELGKGQEIGKNFVFPNGVEVILDGVMLDGKRLLVFYTVNDARGMLAEIMPLRTSIRGMFGRRLMVGGRRAGAIARINGEGTQAKGIITAGAPGIFDRHLSFHFEFRGDRAIREERVIEFTIDRSRAMKSVIEQKLDKTIEVDNSIVQFHSITATPIATVMEGSVITNANLSMPMRSGKGEYFVPAIKIELIADGKIISRKGCEQLAKASKITFYTTFDALPKELERLEIRLVELTNIVEVDQVIEIGLDTRELVFDIAEQEINIKKVISKDESTYVTIVTEESTVLEKVHLIVDGVKVPFEEVMQEMQEFHKTEAGVITHERVLRFAGTGEDLKLKIARIAYTEKYNEIINIPLE